MRSTAFIRLIPLCGYNVAIMLSAISGPSALLLSSLQVLRWGRVDFGEGHYTKNQDAIPFHVAMRLFVPQWGLKTTQLLIDSPISCHHSIFSSPSSFSSSALFLAVDNINTQRCSGQDGLASPSL